MAHRALNPGRVAPEVAPDIRALMSTPEEIAERSGETLRRIAELFPLEEVVKKKDKITGEKMFAEKKVDDEDDEEGQQKVTKDDLTLSNRDEVMEIGTTSPAEDFAKMLTKQPLVTSAQQLEGVILRLLRSTFGKQMYEKICGCLEAYRKACLEKKNPALYNDFMRELKHALENVQKLDLMLDVAGKGLGLISKDEHWASRVTDEEAKRFLMDVEGDEKKASASQEKIEEEEDEDLVRNLLSFLPAARVYAC